MIEAGPVKLIPYGAISWEAVGGVSILSYQTKLGLSPITNGKVIDTSYTRHRKTGSDGRTLTLVE